MYSLQQVPKGLDHDLELKRLENEKLEFISSLLVIVQSFTYSCCSEAAEIRRHARTRNTDYHQKYGVRDVHYDELFINLYHGTSNYDNENLFQGKLGRLRNLSLAITTLSSAVAKDIISLSFISKKPLNSRGKLESKDPFRPLLLNHIMTLAVASTFACCGQRSENNDDSKDFLFFNENSINDVMNIVKLGFLATILQTMLAKIEFTSSMSWNERKEKEQVITNTASGLLEKLSETHQNDTDNWKIACFELLLKTLNSEGVPQEKTKIDPQSIRIQSMLLDACDNAIKASEIFLADMCLMVQIIIPGITGNQETKRLSGGSCVSKLDFFMKWFKFESFLEMIQSAHVQALLKNWYLDAVSIER